MKECIQTCKDSNIQCENKTCRYWIDHSKDLNCTFIAVDNNGEMDLRTIGDILGISFVRVKQIETSALQKINKVLKVLQ